MKGFGGSPDRLECFSTVRRWSMSSNWVTTNLLRKLWNEHAVSTSEAARRQTPPWASTWRGMDGRYARSTAIPVSGLREIRLPCFHSSQAFKHGGRRGAKKVMIVITDGESHDSADLQQVIKDCEKDGITRYAIAVSLLGPLFTSQIRSEVKVSLHIKRSARAKVNMNAI